MKQILILMTFLSSIFGEKAQQSDSIKILHVDTFKKAVMGKNMQLVDVRTQQEYESGHIDNAINIDYFQQGNFEPSFDKLNKEKPVIYIVAREIEVKKPLEDF